MATEPTWWRMMMGAGWIVCISTVLGDACVYMQTDDIPFPGKELFRIVFTLSRASPFAYLSSSPIDKNFCHGHGHVRRVSACSVCASGSLLREAVASAVCGSSRALPSSCLASASSAAWRCLLCNVRSMPALAWSCWTEQVPSTGAHSLAWCAGTRQHFPSVP